MSKMNAVFKNRSDAGQQLAKQCNAYQHSDAIVLGLPRGGVPIAYELAKHLHLLFDVCLVRKLGLPNYPEVAMGAIAEDALLSQYAGNVTIIDRHTTQLNNLTSQEIQAIAAQEKAELKWRESCYRQHRPLIKLANRTIILTDDGIATGLTMHAAVEILRQHQPQKIIIAIPVAAKEAIAKLKPRVDQIICLLQPKSLGAVGFWYEDFNQVSDQEVCDLLSQQSDANLKINH